MNAKIISGFLCCAAMLGVARADIDDDKPWDWERYESYMLRNQQENGTCDAIAEDTASPDLKCAFDKKAWDDHLKKEVKIEKVRKRNHQQPSNCDGGGFLAFRSTSSNGEFPSGDLAATAKAEFKQQVATITCTFDDSDKDHFLTYDPAKKNLVLHITRKEIWNPGWVKGAMRAGDLKKRFPEYDKFFRRYE